MQLKKNWLIGFILLLLIMISVGGVTRLTKSGLSIVEWKPVAGIIPPLSESAWETQFNLYKLSPEYKQVNSNFSIQDYKNIFIWEYLHRVLGRLIFFFVAGFGFYLWRRKLVKGRSVLTLSVLVAFQGLIGWLMVKSGLNMEPHVSPYMLALHFFTALIVLLTAFYYLLKELKLFHVYKINSRHKLLVSIFGLFLLLQVFYGCLVSGLKAGFSFNTYPMMAGDFFPAGGFILEPLWINIFKNPATVQWIHRWLAIMVLVFLLVLTKILAHKKNKSVFIKPLIYLNSLILLQVALGILNILYIVPTPLAVIHQLVASLVVIAYFNIWFRISKTRN